MMPRTTSRGPSRLARLESRHSRNSHTPLAGLFLASAMVLAAGTARAEEPKQECATLLEKASGFARYDATYPQARADLTECSSGHCAGNRALVEVCKGQLKKLDDAVPIFVKVVGAKSAAGGAQVLVDGEAPVAPTLQGNRGFRVKAGAHTLVVKAQGYADAQREITVDPNADEGARTFEIKLVATSGASVPVAPAPAPSSAPAPTQQEIPPETTASSGFPFRPVGVTMGVLGLLGVGAGFVAGSQAMTKRDEAGCNEQSRCATDAQTSQLLDAKNWGNASTIFMIAGGALFTTGLVFWFLAPDKSKANVGLVPTLAPGGGGMFARGTF